MLLLVLLGIGQLLLAVGGVVGLRTCDQLLPVLGVILLPALAELVRMSEPPCPVILRPLAQFGHGYPCLAQRLMTSGSSRRVNGGTLLGGMLGAAGAPVMTGGEAARRRTCAVWALCWAAVFPFVSAAILASNSATFCVRGEALV